MQVQIINEKNDAMGKSIMIEEEETKTFSKSNLINENKVIYLLLRIGYPDIDYGQTTKHISSYQNTARILGIRIVKVIIGNMNRYAFYFRSFLRNDDEANHIGEAILYAASYVFGPIGEVDESVTVFPIPRSIYKHNTRINLSTLIDLEENCLPKQRHLLTPSFSIGSVMYGADYLTSTA